MSEERCTEMTVRDWGGGTEGAVGRVNSGLAQDALQNWKEAQWSG